VRFRHALAQPPSIRIRARLLSPSTLHAPSQWVCPLPQRNTDALGCWHIPDACYVCSIQRILAPGNAPRRIISAEGRCLRVALCHALSHARLITNGRCITNGFLAHLLRTRSRRGSLANSVSRIPMPFLIEFITRSSGDVPPRRSWWRRMFGG
jgi:hypothetical protein